MRRMGIGQKLVKPPILSLMIARQSATGTNDASASCNGIQKGAGKSLAFWLHKKKKGGILGRKSINGKEWWDDHFPFHAIHRMSTGNEPVRHGML